MNKIKLHRKLIPNLAKGGFSGFLLVVFCLIASLPVQAEMIYLGRLEGGKLVVSSASGEAIIRYERVFQGRISTPTGRVAGIQLKEWFGTFGQQYNVNPEVLEKIAFCESGYNPAAVNGPYGGMFQFVASTWVSQRTAMGLDTDPGLRFDTQEAIKTAAFKMSRDGFGAWPACSAKL